MRKQGQGKEPPLVELIIEDFCVYFKYSAKPLISKRNVKFIFVTRDLIAKELECQ
jgi:hypothetical protein